MICDPVVTSLRSMELRGAIVPGRPLVVVAVHLEAEHLGTDWPVLVTGIGKVSASQSILSLLGPLDAPSRPSSLVNLGTAGALRPGVQGTYVVGQTFQHDLDSSAIAELTGTDPSPWLSLGAGPVLATGDQFVRNPEQRSALAERADLVDMEGYAVADAARRLGLKVALVKHVSDDADHGAIKSWVESVAACSEILGRWLEREGSALPVSEVQRAEE